MMGPELVGRLLDEHAAALVLYARQWCAAPEDVVQEAFLKLVSQSKPPASPVGWLYRVVRNGALSAARADRRRRHHEILAAARTAPWFAAQDLTALDAQTVTNALRELSMVEREVIVAHLWGGLTFAQIGELVGCSSSTAHRWYLGALSVLREKLGEPCPKRHSSHTVPSWKQP
jgi:RNA polymerase sigma-70 factor (ECF subfamily)